MSPATRDLATFLRTRLAATLPGPEAQRRFAPRPILERWTPDDRPATARRAAAVVLVHDGVRGPSVPLTLRQADLPHHPGQISLPGGAIDAGEAAETAALRELEEEMGISPDAVEILGALSPLWIPQSNFVLQPFVLVARSPLNFRPHEGEVAQVLDAPVGHLRDRSRVRWVMGEQRARVIDYPYFDVDGARVWGATGMVLSEFVCLWDPDYAPPEPDTAT